MSSEETEKPRGFWWYDPSPDRSHALSWAPFTPEQEARIVALITDLYGPPRRRPTPIVNPPPVISNGEFAFAVRRNGAFDVIPNPYPLGAEVPRWYLDGTPEPPPEANQTADYARTADTSALKAAQCSARQTAAGACPTAEPLGGSVGSPPRSDQGAAESGSPE